MTIPTQTTTLNMLNSLTHKYVVPKVADNFFDSNPFLLKLREAGIRYQGGTEISTPIVYSTGTVNRFANYDLLDVTPTDNVTRARFDWKRYDAPVTYSGSELLFNSGKEAIVDLVETKKTIATLSLQDTMGTDLASDGTTYTKGLVGIKAVCGTTAYASITPSTLTSGGTIWQASVDSTTNTLTLATLQRRIGAVTVGNDKPNLILTTQPVYDKLWNLVNPQGRITFAPDKMLANFGFDHLMINGIPVVVDSHITGTGYGTADSHLYILNLKWLHLYIHSKDNFRFDPVQKPVNQDAYVGHIKTTSALVCNNRRMQGVMTVINPSL